MPCQKGQSHLCWASPPSREGAGGLWALSGLGPHGRGSCCGYLPIASHQPHRGGTATSAGSVSPVPPLPVPRATLRQGNAISCSCGISQCHQLFMWHLTMPSAVHVASHVPPPAGQVSGHWAPRVGPAALSPQSSASSSLSPGRWLCGFSSDTLAEARAGRAQGTPARVLCHGGLGVAPGPCSGTCVQLPPPA